MGMGRTLTLTLVLRHREKAMGFHSILLFGAGFAFVMMIAYFMEVL
jgi:hypothetical protein